MERRDRADYHDPLAGFGGAPPAYSALTLRLVLALFGVIVCCAGAVIFALAGSPLIFAVVFAVLAAVAAVDIGVIIRRKRRGEPG
jgi:membrane protein implicated in regulation of membrane protease activity